MFDLLKRACVGLLAVAPMITTPLHAQTVPQLVRIKQFSALNGTIDFLPGAWVRIRQDSRSTFYAFEKGQFRLADPPDLIREWQAFDWKSVDFLNQIAIQNYDPDLDKFLPKDKHVKKVVDIALPAHDDELLIVCFTSKTTEDFAEPGATDIYLAAVLRKEAGSQITYKLLWAKKMEADASYGDLAFQTIPNLGRFLVLYWASMGGSGGEDALDLYRLKE